MQPVTPLQYFVNSFLSLSMLRLLLSKAQKLKNLWKSSKPYHFGIHWKALIEYSQMSTHLPGFQLFFSFFTIFCIDQISHQQHKGYYEVIFKSITKFDIILSRGTLKYKLVNNIKNIIGF